MVQATGDRQTDRQTRTTTRDPTKVNFVLFLELAKFAAPDLAPGRWAVLLASPAAGVVREGRDSARTHMIIYRFGAEQMRRGRTFFYHSASLRVHTWLAADETFLAAPKSRDNHD